MLLNGKKGMCVNLTDIAVLSLFKVLFSVFEQNTLHRKQQLL